MLKTAKEQITDYISGDGKGCYYTGDMRLAAWLMTCGLVLNRIEYFKTDDLSVVYFIDDGKARDSVSCWMFGKPIEDCKKYILNYRKLMSIRWDFKDGRIAGVYKP